MHLVPVREKRAHNPLVGLNVFPGPITTRSGYGFLDLDTVSTLCSSRRWATRFAGNGGKVGSGDLFPETDVELESEPGV